MALPDLLLQLKDVHFEETDLKGHFTVNFWSFAIYECQRYVIINSDFYLHFCWAAR